MQKAVHKHHHITFYNKKFLTKVKNHLKAPKTEVYGFNFQDIFIYVESIS